MTPGAPQRDSKSALMGEDAYALMQKLYPIPRSITGDGVRETLAILGGYIPIVVHEVPSGTPVFDWRVPKEWIVRDAYVADSNGKRVIDFRQNNLHLVAYSMPVRARMSLGELRPYLHSLPEHPDWIPYRTSYYKDGWGFCLTHRSLTALKDGVYEVVVDSELRDGSLTYGECFLEGQVEDEVLIFTHTCHSSLCNDNLSGIAVTTLLAREVSRWETRRLSYRFVFAPTTIGSITWLARNESKLARIRHGLIVALVGDPGKVTYKKTRSGNSVVDRTAELVLKHRGHPYRIEEFLPYGYDERQFCSPGINLPVGRLTRTPNGRYEQYHTSGDDLDYVTPQSLGDSYEVCREMLSALEGDVRYVNLCPKGEPQLGRQGLYRKTSADSDVAGRDLALLWVLNQSDGDHSLLEIAERAGMSFPVIARAAKDLLDAGLLQPV